MLKHLSLTQYRNLTVDLEIDGHANVVVAPNGTGKSNLLESIYFLATGNTIRPTADLRQVIGFDHEFAKVEANYNDDIFSVVVSEKETRLIRRYQVNGKTTKVSALFGRLPVVLFAPHSVDLVSEDPQGRRHDLDTCLSTVISSYAPLLQRYTRVVKNRNAVLKHIRDTYGVESELKYWDSELVNLATQIVQERTAFLTHVTPLLKPIATELYQHSNGLEFTTEYVCQSEIDLQDYSTSLHAKIVANQAKEIAVGQTLYGPHKDDFVISLNGLNMRYLGSRGQQRIAVLIWKLAQHSYIADKTHAQPVMLIDDLFSELDENHRERAGKYLMGRADMQFILTAVGEVDVPPSFGQVTHIKLTP